MKALFLFVFTLSFTLNSPTNSIFDNKEYVSEEWIVNMLETQFTNDFDSALLKQKLGSYLTLHFDEIEHISGHYAQESDMHYYAVFGKQAKQNKFELIEVTKSQFDAASFKSFDNALAKDGLCRRGNGFPNWPVCPGTACQIWTNGCLGIICNYQECR